MFAPQRNNCRVSDCRSSNETPGSGNGSKLDPPPLNKQDKVNYAIGTLNTGRNQDNAAAFLAYLATDDAQAIYESYGFLRATPEELTVKPL